MVTPVKNMNQRHGKAELLNGAKDSRVMTKIIVKSQAL